jgi:hypothetical protein
MEILLKSVKENSHYGDGPRYLIPGFGLEPVPLDPRAGPFL